MKHVTAVARLKAISAVSALVADRVYPRKAIDESIRPFIVYTRDTDGPETFSGGTTPSRTTRINVVVVADTYDAAWTLAAAIVGDEDATPSGLSGWVDGDGNAWHMMDGPSDANDTVLPGQDTSGYHEITLAFKVDHDGL